MDQNVINFARALSKVESGNNPKAIGDNGTSSGTFQFQEPTWKRYSTEIFGKPVEMTKENAEAVVYSKIKGWKDKGWTPDMIAAAWNAGEGKAIDGSWKTNKGRNEKLGVDYDTPAYVNKVLSEFTKIKQVNKNLNDSYKETSTPASNKPEDIKYKYESLDEYSVRSAFESNPIFAARPGDNPFVQTGKTAVNTISDGLGLAVGLFKAGLSPIDSVKSIWKYAKENPREFILGQAINEPIKTLESDAYTKGLTGEGDMGKAVTEGLNKTAISATNRPLTTILEAMPIVGGVKKAMNPKQAASDALQSVNTAGYYARKGLGAASDITKGAVDVTKMAFKDPKKAASMVGDAVGQIPAVQTFSNFMESRKAVNNQLTKSGLENLIEQQLQSADDYINTFRTKGDIQAELQQIADKGSDAYKAKELEYEAAVKKLDELEQQQSAIINTAAEAAYQESKTLVPNVDTIYKSVVSVFENAKNTASEIYKAVFPNVRIYPKIDEVYSTAKAFLDEIGGPLPENVRSKLSGYIDDIKIKSDIQDILKRANGDMNQFTKIAIKEGKTSLLEYIDNPYYTRAVDLNNLRSFKDTFRNMIPKDNSYAFKKFDEMVGPVIEKTLKDELGKINPELIKSIDKADSMMAQFKGSKIYKELEKATDGKIPDSKAIEKVIKNNYVEFKEMFPTNADMFSTYLKKEILENSFIDETKGYSFKKMRDGLQSNKQYMSSSDFDFIKNLADELEDSKRSIINASEELTQAEKMTREAKNVSEMIGETPADVQSNIQRIKSEKELDKISELTGKTPEELGELYVRAVFESVDKNIKNVTGEAFDFERLNKVIDDIEKLGGNTVESKSISKRMLGENNATLLDELKKAQAEIKRVQKIEPVGKYKTPLNFAKIAAGSLFMTMKFYWTGAHMFIDGTSSLLGKKADEATPSIGRGRTNPDVEGVRGVKEDVSKTPVDTSNPVRDAIQLLMFTTSLVERSEDNNNK